MTTTMHFEEMVRELASTNCRVVAGVAAELAAANAHVRRVEFVRIFLALHEPGERPGQAARVIRETGDLALRIEAFHVLADPRAPAIGELTALAADASPVVREYALQALRRLGGRAPIEVLIAGLEDSDPAARWTAADALIDMGAPALEPLLSAITTRPPSRTFHSAARRVVRRIHVPPELEAGVTALVASLARTTSTYEAGALAFELSREIAGRRVQAAET